MSDVAVAGIRERSLAPIASATPARSKRRLATEVFRGPDAYRALRAEWKLLAERQQSTSVFQSPDMLEAWSRHFATERADDLVTVMVRKDGQAVLIWPLLIERSGLVRTARGAGSPIGQYDEILLDPDCDAVEAFEAAKEALVEAARPDLVLLERVRDDGTLRKALGRAEPSACSEGAPYADLSRGFPHLMASLKSRVVRQQRKRMRRFEQEGSIEFAVAANAEQAEAWLSEAIALKREWLRSTGRISRAFVRRETTECLTEFARTRSEPDAAPRMLVSRLTLDGETAAIEMGFCERGIYHLYLGAFAPAFAKFGPGNVLTEKLLRWCADNGFHRYDMMAPRSRNKGEWQSDEVLVFDFAIPTTLRGRLFVAIFLKRLLPAIRNAFYALPDSLRSRLAGFALRNLSKAQSAAEVGNG